MNISRGVTVVGLSAEVKATGALETYFVLPGPAATVGCVVVDSWSVQKILRSVRV